ncbi:toll/interleukin-1 receptor domain-containing protein [Thalassobaculum sp. OXR-137]|uniref:toll/interleukin-1 receptor domain-containing protein n=1 Tax=Thalassobaculum sp. OXR-137 TaxID=3100173 RepID=UPI002AC93B86|nr:toll/interleukin-1 receptor domain-containing protein [Thalassobaculum sp. OXR-137]WPZ34527.1 toll/interleukin-1 receptor domain-containing protein [Thalassobaculum sp. OXR-137]
MTVKVFISHQQSDSETAGRIAYRLRAVHQIECYLDVIDPNTRQAGNELGDYIRMQLGTCTQLLAVVSESTKTSWWVPWEIGVATEKDQPIATFSTGFYVTLPEYLKKWPYLQSERDLDEYARVSKETDRALTSRKTHLREAVAQHQSTADFYRVLRSRLGQ